MCNNRERYNQEKEDRWWTAEEYEQPAIEHLANNLNNRFKKCNIMPIRYDDIWFENYDPDIIPWVRGCSDYCIDIEKEGNHIYMYTEVKIKNKQFYATVKGGRIKTGETVSQYGCKSFYLDIYVHNHMNEFCDIANIDRNTFIIMFTDSKFKFIRFISVEELNNLLENGWKSYPISEIEGGYGSRSYLIPIDATHRIEDLSGQQIRDYCSDIFIKPK